tara:strand:- start:596 stop:880 length:285 start_codon:yes stop_codon:yes gene_type:complete
MDKRKQNGGHSTKATGADKRKNQYKELLDLASTPEDVVEVIKTLKQKAINNQDVNAIKLFLEYYLGKPKETKEIDLNLNEFSIKDIFKIDKDKS